MLSALEGDGLSKHICLDLIPTRWSLTDGALNRVVGHCRYMEPGKTFGIRPNLALGDRTTFELDKMLELEDWAFQEWLPPSKRKRGSPLMLENYCSGDAKIWYGSQKTVSRNYMLALLNVALFLQALGKSHTVQPS